MPFAYDLSQRCSMFGITIIPLTMLVENVYGITLGFGDDLTRDVRNADGKIVVQCGSSNSV